MGCVCVGVCMGSQGGFRVNWCCVLKVVNEAGEHPRSRCVMHTNTPCSTSRSQTAKLHSACLVTSELIHQPACPPRRWWMGVKTVIVNTVWYQSVFFFFFPWVSFTSHQIQTLCMFRCCCPLNWMCWCFTTSEIKFCLIWKHLQGTESKACVGWFYSINPVSGHLAG